MHGLHRAAGGRKGRPPRRDDLDDETRDYLASRAHLPDLVNPMHARPGDYIHGLLLTGAWPRDGATASGYRRQWVYEGDRESWRCLEAP